MIQKSVQRWYGICPLRSPCSEPMQMQPRKQTTSLQDSLCTHSPQFPRLRPRRSTYVRIPAPQDAHVSDDWPVAALYLPRYKVLALTQRRRAHRSEPLTRGLQSNMHPSPVCPAVSIAPARYPVRTCRLIRPKPHVCQKGRARSPS
jgi:hypothetical protein